MGPGVEIFDGAEVLAVDACGAEVAFARGALECFGLGAGEPAYFGGGEEPVEASELVRGGTECPRRRLVRQRFPCDKAGARGGTRTRTLVKATDFESVVSANSTTRAGWSPGTDRVQRAA